MSEIVQYYLNLTYQLVTKMREIPDFTRTEEFDVINHKLTELYRLMTEEERSWAHTKLR
jgi:hypothetical protein